VAPEKINETLNAMAKQRREIVAVEEDRPAETGDVLTVDFEGTVDGVAFEGGTATDAKVEIGGEGFIPGFTEGMLGMKIGETRDVDVSFPETYHAEAVAGKAAVFKVTAKALGKPAETLVDDAFASKLGFETVEKLRETITGQIQRELDLMARMRIKREVLDVLAETANFPAPQNLVEAEFSGIWQRVEHDMKQGEIDEEDRGKDAATLKSEYRAIADRRVRLGLLLAEIGRTANIQVSQTEITQAIRQEAARYPGQEMKVVEFFRKTPGAIEQLQGPIFEDKVVDYILEIAKIEDRIVPPEELAMPPADEPAAPKLTFEAISTTDEVVEAMTDEAPSDEAAPIEEAAEDGEVAA
jgi:trigger factor